MLRKTNFNLLIGILLLIFGGGSYSAFKELTGMLLIIFGLLFLTLSFFNKSVFRSSFFKAYYKQILVISSIIALLFFGGVDRLTNNSTVLEKTSISQEIKEKVINKSKTKLKRTNSLFEPNKTCNLFRLNGYEFYSWKGHGDWWSCLSQLQYNYLDGSINVVSFYAESPHGGDKIESIKIQADIFDVSFKYKVKKEYLNQIKEFFKKSKIKIPGSLTNHINIESNYTTNAGSVNISFEVDRSYKEGYGLILIIAK